MSISTKEPAIKPAVSSPDVLIKEARQRGRRTQLRVGFTIILVVGIVAVLVIITAGTTMQGRTARSPEIGKVTVLLPRGSRMHVLGELNALSCPTSTNCWAVGVHYGPAAHFQSFDEPASLIEHWTDGHWRTVPSPTLKDFAPLVAVSCPTPTDCVAGGREWGDFGVGYTEIWSRHRWSLVPPGYYGGTPWTVSCPRLNECVGTYYDHGSNYWAELWNGDRWLLLDPPGRSQALFTDASCGSPQSCWFIGASDDGDAGVAVGWINHHWSSAYQVGPVGANMFRLESISCIGSNFCVAIGSGKAFASAIWNGHQWKVVKTPPTSQALAYNMSVACQSAADCLAVGGETVERFNGTTWIPLKLQVPRGLPRVTLSGITTSKRGTYLVVGTTGDGSSVSGNAVIGVLDGRRLSLTQN